MSKIIIFDYKNFKKISVVLLGLILLSSIPAYQAAFAVGFSFSSQIDLSSDSGTSRDPQIFASGNNVYVVFRNSTSGINNIYFSASTDGGTNFSTAADLSQSSGVLSETPQIAASGSNVYAVWEEGNTIVLKRSNDSGGSFPFSTTTLSSGTASFPQIEATGNNVFATFQDGADVFLSSSTDSGSNFSSSNLSGLGSGVTPQIAVSGSNTYVVWQDTNDISFVKISNNGQNVGSVQDISGTSGTTSQKPQIAVSGTDVYVTWIEGTSDIFFKRITSDGTDFTAAIENMGAVSVTGSSNPQIAASGSNVYVTWRENISSINQIQLNRSTDSGQNFAGAQNRSNNDGSSIKPQLAASGDNVYVVWRDNTTGNNDILFRGSDDAGANFENSITVSPTSPAGTSNNPQIAISGSDAHVVWQDKADGDNDILYKKATQVTTTVSFDQSTYKLSDSATITITDSSASGSGTITASVTSSIFSHFNRRSIWNILRNNYLF